MIFCFKALESLKNTGLKKKTNSSKNMLNFITLIGPKYAKNFQGETKRCVTVVIVEYKMKPNLIGQIKRIKTSKNTFKSIR